MHGSTGRSSKASQIRHIEYDMLAAQYPLMQLANIASHNASFMPLQSLRARAGIVRPADDHFKLSNISKRATKSHMDRGDSLMTRAATSQVMLLTCKPQCTDIHT